MHKLGYRRKRHRKGVYWDGHERKDVIKHRSLHLEKMAELDLFVSVLQCGKFLI